VARLAPGERRRLLEQQVARHHAHAAGGGLRLDLVLADRQAGRAHAQHARRRRPVQVGVQQPDAAARPRERRGQPRAHQALAHPALAAHHRHDVTHAGEPRANALALRLYLAEQVGAVVLGELAVAADALHALPSFTPRPSRVKPEGSGLELQHVHQFKT